jgi:hypothetical protein
MAIQQVLLRPFTKCLQHRTCATTRALSNAVYNNKVRSKTGGASGNCTWPSFRSLGWCNNCQDVTPQVRSICSY